MAAARALRRHARQRPPRDARRVPVPGPLGRASGAGVACSSPATPPTRRRRSPGRACAPACETPPTWRGSSTWCCRDLAPDALLDAYGLGAGAEHASRHRAGHRHGQAHLRRPTPRRPQPATRRSSPPTTAASPTSRRSPPSPPASCSPAHRTPASSSSRPRSRRDGRAGPVRRRRRRRMAAGHARPSPALDRELADWFASIGGAVVARRRRVPSSPDVDGAYGTWFADHGVVGRAAAARLRALRDGRGRGRDRRSGAVAARTRSSPPEIDFREVRSAHGPCTARTVPRGGRLRGGAIRHPVRSTAAVCPASPSTRSPSSTASASASSGRRSPASPARTWSRRRPSGASGSARSPSTTSTTSPGCGSSSRRWRCDSRSPRATSRGKPTSSPRTTGSRSRPCTSTTAPATPSG